MLVCLLCQHENSDTQSFCQQCGTSLTHQPCQNCGQEVSFQLLNCPSCGATTGAIRWAIIQANHAELQQTALAKELPAYLDSQRRYQLLSWENNQNERAIGDTSLLLLQGKAIDLNPLQKSCLQLERSTQLTDGEYQNREATWRQLRIPEIAFSYLILQEYSPTVPEIYDAWQEENWNVLLLPDRSKWQLLNELWQQQTLPALQLLHYLDEMAQLWQALTAIGCRQSLLLPHNLRVDEDQILGLQQLYADAANTDEVEAGSVVSRRSIFDCVSASLASPGLKSRGTSDVSLVDLAYLWQGLFSHSEHQPSFLSPLIESVAAGEIATVDHLRSQLQTIASDYQPATGDDLLSSHLLYNSEGDDMPTVVLPMELLNLSEAGSTDIGCRQQNEDFFSIEVQINKQENSCKQTVRAKGLYIVCDGMGGHARGEVASSMAVSTLQHYFQAHWNHELPDRKTIEEGILAANQAIYTANTQDACLDTERMGTTLAMALIYNTQVAIAHVGDSRIYRVTRKGGVELLTLDHAVGQREIQRGVEPEVAYARPDAYQLTQALGPRDNGFVKPDIQFLTINEDTLLLLCSDGLSDNQLIESQGEMYLTPLISSSVNLEQGLHKLIELANQCNGHDNITGVVVRIKVQPVLENKPLF